MTAEDFATVLSAVGDSWPAAIVVVAAVIAVVAWRALPQLVAIRGDVRDVRHEFSSNSGTTLRDGIDRLEASQRRQTLMLTEHIAEDQTWKLQVEDLLTQTEKDT